MAVFIMQNTYGEYDYEICFYVIPSFLAYLSFVLFLAYPESELYATLGNIYSIYITITTVILAALFAVIALAAAFLHKDPDQKFKNISTAGTTPGFPANSTDSFSITQSVLYHCVSGLALSLMACIFTASHLFPVYLLKLYYLFTTFFVLGSIFGLVLLSAKTLKTIKSLFA
jgi:hypothetical protein